MAGIVAVVLMAVVVAVSAVLVNSYRSKRSAATIQAIAVMPFVNEGGNADLEYLSDGMTETLIGDLSQLPNLSVKARSSVFRYKGKDANAQTIGKELNVQAILNGRIIQHGDQLDLNMELVDAATENVLWTQHGINFYKAVCLAVSGRRDEAVQQFKRIQEMDPTFPWAHSFLARVYVWMGNRAAAVEERAKALELNGKPEDAKLIRESFAKAGWDGFLREGARQGREPFFKLALLSNANDADKEAMVKALTEGVERGGFWLFLIKTDPLYDPLRGDPRFQELLKKFNPPK